MNETYRVTLQGTRAEFTEAQVVNMLVPLFNRAEEEVRRALGVHGLIVKKDVDLSIANKYQHVLEECGCVSLVEREFIKETFVAPYISEKFLSVRERIIAIERKEFLHGISSDADFFTVRILHALTEHGADITLRGLCGDEVNLERLMPSISGFRLWLLVSLGETWINAHSRGVDVLKFGSYGPEENGKVFGHLQELIEAFEILGLVKIDRFATNEHDQCKINLIGGEVFPREKDFGKLLAVGQEVQFCRFDESTVITARIDRIGKHNVRLEHGAAGRGWRTTFQSILFGPSGTPQTVNNGRLPGWSTIYDVVKIIPITGFDSAGEPEIRLMNEGSIELAFNFMPPSWGESLTEVFDTFDKKLGAAIGEWNVEWQDREFFRITHPEPETVDLIVKYLQSFSRN